VRPERVAPPRTSPKCGVAGSASRGSAPLSVRQPGLIGPRRSSARHLPVQHSPALALGRSSDPSQQRSAAQPACSSHQVTCRRPTDHCVTTRQLVDAQYRAVDGAVRTSAMRDVSARSGSPFPAPPGIRTQSLRIKRSVSVVQCVSRNAVTCVRWSSQSIDSRCTAGVCLPLCLLTTLAPATHCCGALSLRGWACAPDRPVPR
jgi:hypothetical protein